MWGNGESRMELTSTAFTNGNPLPAANIYNVYSPGSTFNVCSATGAMGGDQSPQLGWKRAPHNTRSFVIVLYDTTAAFAHWGMYNIPPYTHMLPEDAGVADSQTVRGTEQPGPRGFDGGKKNHRRQAARLR